MCGIVFKHNFDKSKPVNNDILQQYDKQSHRGKQGFGIFDGQYMNMVHESREDNILKWLVKKDSNLILFHHRLPTSTVNVAKAAHPFSTKKYFPKVEYILVHNGVIRNANELWVEHQKLGIRYSSMLDDLSFNDSEALLWDFALTMEGKQPDMKAHGSMAFIAMRKINGKLRSVMYGRNSNPLNIKRTPESIELASEGPGVSILSNILYNFDLKTHVTSKSDMTFPQYKPAGTATHWNHVEQKYPNSGFHPNTQTSLLPANVPHARHDDGDAGEYDSYDDWHNNKYGVKSATAGAPPLTEDKETKWQRLRAKYGKKPEDMEIRNIQSIEEILRQNRLDAASAKSIGQILDAKKDKHGRFVVAEIQHGDAIDMDNIDLRDYSPLPGEIQNCAMEYMIEAQGNFEDAYGLLEYNYGEFMDEVKGHETFSDIRQTLLFEAAMEFINKDPEYRNNKSISSLWAALWAQQETAKI